MDEQGRCEDPGEARRRRRHDAERVRRSVENLERLLREHDWHWSRESHEFLERLGCQGASAELDPRAESDDLEQAQELVYQAWGATAQQRRALAQAAIEICRDCADAYTLLGDTTDDIDRACSYYRQGVEAGERVLGLDAFVRYRGRFWQVDETRPYMRAKLSLADCLCGQGRYEEAARHFEELLQLNPNDDQGVRYWYSLCLFAMEDDEALQHLLDRFSWDMTAPWTYARALFLYRTRGPERARGALRQALASNRHVPDFLLAIEDLPTELPDAGDQIVGIGSKEEAAAVAEALYEAWDDTPGALAWLREMQREPGNQTAEA
jgi:tetratricopeptide (TPR) repeat protein